MYLVPHNGWKNYKCHWEQIEGNSPLPLVAFVCSGVLLILFSLLHDLVKETNLIN